MKIKEAVRFLECARPAVESTRIWADLGCGEGIFTHALAQLIEPKGVVFAIDQDKEVFTRMRNAGASIECVEGDFERDDLDLPALDGILMANSMHYVKDKPALLNRLKDYLNEDGMFMVIEYDTEKTSPWVPYPLKFKDLRVLFRNAGYSSVQKVGERPSIYGGYMYASVISKDVIPGI